MSAWLCTPAHIGRLVAFLRADRDHRDKDPEHLATLLAKANLKSVAYRYDEREDQAAADYNTADSYIAACITDARQPLPLFTPIVALKQAKCFEYQSCEPPDWDHSEAARLIQLITWSAIYRLPGWEAAPWGYDPPAPNSARLLSVLK